MFSRLEGRARGQGPGAGLRLAAAERPDLELLGQQLPDGQGAAGLRHPLLERRHDAPAGARCTPTCSRCIETDGVTARAARRSAAMRSSLQRHHAATAYLMGGETDHITPWDGCYRHARAARRAQRPSCSASGHIQSLINPPGNPKARFLTNAGAHATPRGVPQPAPRPTPAAGGRTGSPGSTPAAATSARRRPRARAGTRRSAPRPAPTCARPRDARSARDGPARHPHPADRRPGGARRARTAGPKRRPHAPALQRHRRQPRDGGALRGAVPRHPRRHLRRARRRRLAGAGAALPLRLAGAARARGCSTASGIGAVDVFGVSWGGALAQQFAHDHPDALPLADAGRDLRRLRDGARRARACWCRMRDPAALPRPGLHAARSARDIYGGSCASTATLLAEHAGAMRAASRRGYLYQLLAGVGWTSWLWLPACGCRR